MVIRTRASWIHAATNNGPAGGITRSDWRALRLSLWRIVFLGSLLGLLADTSLSRHKTKSFRKPRLQPSNTLRPSRVALVRLLIKIDLVWRRHVLVSVVSAANF